MYIVLLELLESEKAVFSLFVESSILQQFREESTRFGIKTRNNNVPTQCATSKYAIFISR